MSKAKKLAELVKEVVPYIDSTLATALEMNGDRKDWGLVHKGRASSSINQMKALAKLAQEVGEMKTLRHLLDIYGKAAMNSMTKYPSILTYHALGEGEILLPEITTPFGDGEAKFATEKIDGCNTRLIFYKGDFMIGSREDILHLSTDAYYDTRLDMVETMYKLVDLQALAVKLNEGEYKDSLVVIYGEFYGGKTTSQSKNYGKDAHGFRVFDVCSYDEDLFHTTLAMEPSKISLWREVEREGGMVYGQPFMSVMFMNVFCDVHGLTPVPMVPFFFNGTSHEQVLSDMKQALPETLAPLSQSALKRPEGIVVRSNDRKHIVKLRFENYERALRHKAKAQ